MDQMLALKNECEKYLWKKKDLHVAFMDLKKAYSVESLANI